jgi:hypothetical protein
MSKVLEEYPGYLILLHPNIPKPLHGLNPRTLDPQWWELRRRQAYARFDNCCWACKVHRSKARFQHFLDAHECYLFNYQEATAVFLGVSALCYCCHNFIHDGRLQALCQQHKISMSRYRAVITHGNEILRSNGISYQKHINQPSMVPLCDNPFIEISQTLKATSPPSWTDWRLIIGKKSYKPLYKSMEAWKKHYS